MRFRNISKKVKGYIKIHRKHIGKTVVVQNLQVIESFRTGAGQIPNNVPIYSVCLSTRQTDPANMVLKPVYNCAVC